MLTAVRLLSQQPIQRFTLDVFVRPIPTVSLDNLTSGIAYDFLYVSELTVCNIGVRCFGPQFFLYPNQVPKSGRIALFSC